MAAEGRRTGILHALAAATAYGTLPSMVRAASSLGVPAVESAVLRTLLAATLLGAVVAVSGAGFRVPRAARAAFAGQALATLAISVSYLMAVEYIPVGLAVIIFFTFPVLITLAAPLVEGHRPATASLVAAGLAFAGLALAIGPRFDGLDPRGLALAAIAALGAVVQFFTGRMLARHMQPSQFGALVHLLILPALLALALSLHGGSLALMGAQGWGLVLAGALSLLYGLGYMMHMRALSAAPASVVAPFFNLEPVVGLSIAALALGERLALLQYVGGGLVLAALLVAASGPAQAEAR
jgi:drug/metabolite transporter (DMT)-like permease